MSITDKDRAAAEAKGKELFGDSHFPLQGMVAEVFLAGISHERQAAKAEIEELNKRGFDACHDYEKQLEAARAEITHWKNQYGMLDATNNASIRILKEALQAEKARHAKEVKVLVEALESIACWHLSEDKIKACGGDEVLADTQIARDALAKYKGGVE
jgi:hypothetical protein